MLATATPGDLMDTTHADVAGPRRGSEEPPAARVQVTGPVDAVVALTVSGHLDTNAAGGLTHAIDTLLHHVAGGIDRVILDLTEVTSLTLEALTPLVRLARACRTATVPLHVALSPEARRKVALTGLAAVLPEGR
ncbi:STAS domain-containing protein [Amycolatopsis sp. lyj-23]|uniref:STAS domain-containing protein n=1 Tax=Amycolatopsis sp. lyj-23 TaxID=2789283 RepID=UPI003977EC5C